ncbi:hypothetical protein BDZ90DRAFT_271783 [Jaminaea rosea]|uniref:Uncharacterized protein n=1 Tax=Jaminaea rosea TaxID=1569628 RepID=A0A316URE2_9BASI|nr:hypothetical protein BDZ90DRAFT_271783 [Jaminaea rosea]PWN27862.1 hypothetical protein BDZ90DRAFT_271783 [Jaminaea rosea]
MGQGQSHHGRGSADTAPQPIESQDIVSAGHTKADGEEILPPEHDDESSFTTERDPGNVGPMRRRPRPTSGVSFQPPALSRWNAHRDMPLQSIVDTNSDDVQAQTQVNWFPTYPAWDNAGRNPPVVVTPTATAALRAIHRVSNPPLYPDIPEVPEEGSDFGSAGVGGGGGSLLEEAQGGNESGGSAGTQPMPPPRPLPSPLAEALMMGLGRSGSGSSSRRASEPQLSEASRLGGGDVSRRSTGQTDRERLVAYWESRASEASSPAPPVVRRASWSSGPALRAPRSREGAATLGRSRSPLAPADEVAVDPYEETAPVMAVEDAPTPYGPQPSVYGTPAIVLDADSPDVGTFPWSRNAQQQEDEAASGVAPLASSPIMAEHALLVPPPITRAADPTNLSTTSGGESDEAVEQIRSPQPSEGSLKRKAAPLYVSQLEGEPVQLRSPPQSLRSPPRSLQIASPKVERRAEVHHEGQSRFSQSSNSDAALRSEVNMLRAGPSTKRDSSLIHDLFRPSRQRGSREDDAARPRKSSFFSRLTGRARKGSGTLPQPELIGGSTIRASGLPSSSRDSMPLQEPPIFQIRPRMTSAPPEMGSLARRLQQARDPAATPHKSPRLTQHTVGGSVRRVPSFAGSHGSIRSKRSARSGARSSATSLRQAYVEGAARAAQRPGAKEGWEDIAEDEVVAAQANASQSSFKVKRKRVPLGVMFGWPRRGSKQLHPTDVEALDARQRAVSEPPRASAIVARPAPDEPLVQKIDQNHQLRPPSDTNLLTTPHYSSSTSSFSSLAPPPAPQPVPPKRPRRPRRRTGSGSQSESGGAGQSPQPSRYKDKGKGKAKEEDETSTPFWDDSIQTHGDENEAETAPVLPSPRGTLATIHSVPWRADEDVASRMEILHSDRGSPLPRGPNSAELYPRPHSKLSASYLDPDSRPSSRATAALRQQASGQTFGVDERPRTALSIAPDMPAHVESPVNSSSADFGDEGGVKPPPTKASNSQDSSRDRLTFAPPPTTASGDRDRAHVQGHAAEGSNSSFTKIAGDDEDDQLLRSRIKPPSLAESDVSKTSVRGHLSSSATLATEGPGGMGTTATVTGTPSTSAGTPRGQHFPLGAGAGHRRTASGSAASGRLSTHLESPRARVSSLGMSRRVALPPVATTEGLGISSRDVASTPPSARAPIDGLPATGGDVSSLPLPLGRNREAQRESWTSADGPWRAEIVQASSAIPAAPTMLPSIPQGRTVGRQRSRSSMNPRTEPLDGARRPDAPMDGRSPPTARNRAVSEPLAPQSPPIDPTAAESDRWSPVDYDAMPAGGTQASLATLIALEKQSRGEPTTSRFLGSTLYALPARKAENYESSSSLGPPQADRRERQRQREAAAATVANLSGSRMRERAAPYERRRPSDYYSSSWEGGGYSSAGTSTIASRRRRRSTLRQQQRRARHGHGPGHGRDWTGMALASSDNWEESDLPTTADERERYAARRSMEGARQRREARPPGAAVPGRVQRPPFAGHGRQRSAIETPLPRSAAARLAGDEGRIRVEGGVWEGLAEGGWQHYVTPPRHLAEQAAAALRAVSYPDEYEAEDSRPRMSSPIIVIQPSQPGRRSTTTTPAAGPAPPLPQESTPTAAGANTSSEHIISTLQRQLRELESRLEDELSRSRIAAVSPAASRRDRSDRPAEQPSATSPLSPARRPLPAVQSVAPSASMLGVAQESHPIPAASGSPLTDGLSPQLLEQHEDLARRVRGGARTSGATQPTIRDVGTVPFPSSSRPPKNRPRHSAREERRRYHEDDYSPTVVDEFGRTARPLPSGGGGASRSMPLKGDRDRERQRPHRYDDEEEPSHSYHLHRNNSGGAGARRQDLELDVRATESRRRDYYPREPEEEYYEDPPSRSTRYGFPRRSQGSRRYDRDYERDYDRDYNYEEAQDLEQSDRYYSVDPTRSRRGHHRRPSSTSQRGAAPPAAALAPAPTTSSRREHAADPSAAMGSGSTRRQGRASGGPASVPVPVPVATEAAPKRGSELSTGGSKAGYQRKDILVWRVGLRGEGEGEGEEGEGEGV